MDFPTLLGMVIKYALLLIMLSLTKRTTSLRLSRLITLMITLFIKSLTITLQVRSTLIRLRVITLTVGLIWLGWLGTLGLSIGVREWLIIVLPYLMSCISMCFQGIRLP